MENLYTILKKEIIINKKSIFYELIGMVIIYLSLKMLMNDKESLSWTVGVAGLYLSNYILIELFKNIFMVEKQNNIIPIFLKLSTPIFMLKVVRQALYKKSIYIVAGIVISSIIILIIEYVMNKKMYTKEILSIDKIESIFIALIPFFILKNGSNYALITLYLLIIIQKILKKEKISNVGRNVGILIVLFLLTVGISSYYNQIGEKGILVIKVMVMTMISLFFFMNWTKKNVEYRNIMLVTVNAVNIFYFTMLLNILKKQGKILLERHGSFIDITQTGVILGILSLLFIVIIINKKKIILMPYLILNFVLLLTTGSRGPLLMTVLLSIVIIVISIQSKKKLMQLFCVVTAAMVALVLFGNIKIIERIKTKDASNSARMALYKESYRQFLEKPLQGQGLGTYLEIASKYREDEINAIYQKEIKTTEEEGRYEAYNILWYSHSNPLLLLRSSGIFSFIFYYLLIAYLMYLIVKNYFKNKNIIFIFAICSVLYFEIYGLIDNVIIYERLQLIHFYIIALAYSYGRKECDQSKIEKKNVPDFV